VLDRSFTYDGTNGVNGVSRFTDFTFETVLCVHPSIEYTQVEYAVRAFREHPDNANVFLKPKTNLVAHGRT